MTKSRSNATAPNAKGTLVVGSGTDASTTLAVGTNNYVLTADSAEASGVKWAAPSGGDFVKITAYSATSSTASPISFNNVFSSTYRYYKILINAYSSSGEVQFRLRNAGTDRVDNAYYYALNLTANSGTNTIQNASTTNNWKMCDANVNGYSVDLTIYNPKLTTPYVRPEYTAVVHTRSSDRGGYNTGFYDNYYDNDGFSILHAGGFQGTITVYGLVA